jgi:hypothetical protein
MFLSDFHGGIETSLKGQVSGIKQDFEGDLVTRRCRIGSTNLSTG